MEDDIIAYAYFPKEEWRSTMYTLKAHSAYVPARLQRARTLSSHHERESTEPPENQGASPLDYMPCLVVRFSAVPRTDKGLVFGSNSSCDVRLHVQGISGDHFSLTFDELNRPIVKDLGSTRGTQVTYAGKGTGIRSGFQWIIGGLYNLERNRDITIEVLGNLRVCIVVPCHDITSPAYIDRVNRFKQGTATAEDLLDDLGLSRQQTRVATEAHTPGIEPIYLKKKLGKGSYGTVTRKWNVSTGEVTAVKQPSTEALRRGDVSERMWRREARIMGLVTHPHIVTLLWASFTPHPQICMEYIPCGSLQDQRNISYNETVTIVSQCLSALTYLHERKPPIAHRDIKPANILVQYRSGGDINVKLGDFGLSLDSLELLSRCGSDRYIAPEIYSEAGRSGESAARQGYTPAVDIWSLGVVACELTCGLPRGIERRDRNWCEKIVKKLGSSFQRSPSNLGQFLLDTMIIMSPGSRLSARDCHDRVVDLPNTQVASEHTSALAPDSAEEERIPYGAENLAAVVWQPSSSTETDTPSNLTRQGAVPTGSVPTWSGTTWRTDEAYGVPSPSAGMQHTAWQRGQMNNWASQPLQGALQQNPAAHTWAEGQVNGWASQPFQGALQQDPAQTWAGGSQTWFDPGLASSSIPQSEG